MAEHAAHPPHHDDVAHEGSDVNLRGILLTAAGLLALGAVVYFVVYLLFWGLTRRADVASGQLEFPLAAGQENRLPPEPRLQTNPRQDMKDLREEEDARLKSYGWVDRNAGVVRIPIDEAMKLTLQRGLASRPATEQQVVK
jgi:hypothetical protein